MKWFQCDLCSFGWNGPTPWALVDSSNTGWHWQPTRFLLKSLFFRHKYLILSIGLRYSAFLTYAWLLNCRQWSWENGAKLFCGLFVEDICWMSPMSEMWGRLWQVCILKKHLILKSQWKLRNSELRWWRLKEVGQDWKQWDVEKWIELTIVGSCK